ncbi:hypothetical protein EVAR_90719_1 [Eumeta japonica]|uniref:Uncharacterized protein n=1 Tax=Eumeta variegata TaxID=151549 RepID=A0A4C1ZIB0_EUMVA|nr:hypothetical protein EVAR_90719_1 [Eumeta japonica]
MAGLESRINMGIGIEYLLPRLLVISDYKLTSIPLLAIKSSHQLSPSLDTRGTLYINTHTDIRASALCRLNGAAYSGTVERVGDTSSSPYPSILRFFDQHHVTLTRVWKFLPIQKNFISTLHRVAQPLVGYNSSRLKAVQRQTSLRSDGVERAIIVPISPVPTHLVANKGHNSASPLLNFFTSRLNLPPLCRTRNERWAACAHTDGRAYAHGDGSLTSLSVWGIPDFIWTLSLQDFRVAAARGGRRDAASAPRAAGASAVLAI